MRTQGIRFHAANRWDASTAIVNIITMSPRLTPKQAAGLRDLVQPMLGFLLRAQAAGPGEGFQQHSKLLRLVDKAYDAMHSLHIELHYISCKRGVGRRDEH